MNAVWEFTDPASIPSHSQILAGASSSITQKMCGMEPVAANGSFSIMIPCTLYAAPSFVDAFAPCFVDFQTAYSRACSLPSPRPLISGLLNVGENVSSRFER